MPSYGEQRGIMVPVDAPAIWHALMRKIDVRTSEPMRVLMSGCHWRRNGEVWPDDEWLQQGSSVYLVHCGSVRLRCSIASVVHHPPEGVHKYAGVELSFDPREATPVGLDWTFGPEFRRGWRWALHTDGSELPNPNWRNHDPHDECPGVGAYNTDFRMEIRRERARRLQETISGRA